MKLSLAGWLRQFLTGLMAAGIVHSSETNNKGPGDDMLSWAGLGRVEVGPGSIFIMI